MKKLFVFASLIGLLILPACGSAETAASSGEAEDQVEASLGEAEDQAAEQVDMIYFKQLDDSSMMAACYTDEGIARLGADYYVVHVGDAQIYNAEGEAVALDQLVRGCPIQIQWPGMVMESYPGQINAEVVRALEDKDWGVPPEDEIPALFDGPKWWEETPVTEVPDLSVEYTSSDYSVCVRVEKRNGSWRYAAESEGTFQGSAVNGVRDGLSPQKWTYDDGNTIQRTDFDTVKLSFEPEPQSLRVMAYVYGDGTDRGQEVPVSETGVMNLLKGDYIYVVTADWDGDSYGGSGTYGFLVEEK